MLRNRPVNLDNSFIKLFARCANLIILHIPAIFYLKPATYTGNWFRPPLSNTNQAGWRLRRRALTEGYNYTQSSQGNLLFFQHKSQEVVNALVDNLDLDKIKALYKEYGRSPYHPQMMLKVIIYAYMNNVYSCRKIEKLLLRDIHYIWLAGYEKPDFITINRFRNRVKHEINQIFTQLVLLLAGKGYVSLDVEYIDGTKIESKANIPSSGAKAWRRTETNFSIK